MFVRPEIGYVRAKIGLTGQFDRSQPGNYLQPCYGETDFINKNIFSVGKINLIVRPLKHKQK